ncbi:hypothetical protein D3C71_1362310 [compost metagenome]
MQQRTLLIRRAPHHPCFGQRQQAVDEHLAAAIQALGESLQPAFPVDQGAPGAQVKVIEQRPVAGIVALTRQQRGRHRVAHGANADLQRAAIAHQRTGVQADAMVLGGDRHVGRGEQPALLGFIDQQVERIVGQLGIAGHVGQLGVDLA